MKGPIQSVEVSYIVHATEDGAKIARAVSSLIGIDAEPEAEALQGHFGNEIVRANLHLTGEEAQAAFRRVVGAMPGALREELLAELGTFLDEHSSLFLRFDKQSLVSGAVALGKVDPVRLKVKPRIFLLKGGAAQFYSEMIEGG